jgi:putative transposase
MPGIAFRMPNYRRAFVPGGCYFFTVTLLDRGSRLLVDRIDALNEAIRKTQRRFPFEIDAMVVLPDHLHAVWSLPDGDQDFSVRWRWIKSRFSRSMPDDVPLNPVQQARGERGIWQRRFWEHLIRDERDFRHHVQYCWFNPVKHGYVADAAQWPHSTFRRDNQEATLLHDLERSLADFERSCPGREFGERV